jgi:L-ascorbate metabolism protein UlaG (beta-lactamase superfamily)
MIIRWYGQSSFSLEDGGTTVFIDPFGDMSAAASRGLEFAYPAIEGVSADLLLVTHEHGDHNAVEVIDGEPRIIRSTTGTWDDVVGVASEHDEVAGTQRGPNAIFVFTLGGKRICHLGDFGQPALRPEQRAAIGDVDILFVPVGGGPTIGGERAADLVRELAPDVVVPMHYRTPAINFLEPPDAFLEALGAEVTRLDASELDPAQHSGVVLPAVPA